MQDCNVVVLVGRLTRDPELAHTANETALCKMRLAFSTRAKDPSTGVWGDKSNYIDVIVWGKQGESCAEHLAKGRRIGVSGHLEWREWDTKDAGKRQQIELVADAVQFLDGKSTNGGDGNRAPSAAEMAAEQGAYSGVGADYGAAAAAGADDDIPF